MTIRDACSAASLAAAFSAHGSFPFPAAPLMAGRQPERLASAVAGARRRLGSPWPALTVSGYLRYYRDGDRSGYERPYFQRRRRLGAAALAWAATGEPDFAADAADGIYLVCEESTWCVPAHARHSLADDVPNRLPPPGGTGYLDLFNCETALVLAEACQVAAAGLDAIDHRIATRARDEIRRRVIDPILAGTETWWMQGQNNWSVWCASSAIIAAGYALAAEPAAWGRLVHRMLGVVDRYVANQGADGGCDEGVMYWSVAGGCVVRALEEVHARTGGVVDGWRSDPRIAEIMRFPARMHLGRGTVPAFADGLAQVLLPVGALARAAARTASPEILALARQVADPVRETDADAPGVGDLLTNQLRALAWFETAPPTAPAELRDAWLPDLQVMVAHGGGTSLAVKGGHNAENHNHNDVGQFVIHRDGVPLVVDAGRGDYTAQTFGPRRYELWWTRGSGHAVPQIDGHEQAAGADRRARTVVHAGDAASAGLQLDLAGCYPAAAGLRILHRTVELDRATGAVRLTDRVDAGRAVGYVLPLVVTAEPRGDGEGAWIVEHGGQRLRIAAGAGLSGTVEPIVLDATLAANWGALWRLTLRGTVGDGGMAEVGFSC